MKVLHVIQSVDPREGGPIAGVLSGSAVWAQHGHERHILCLDDPAAPWVTSSPVKVIALGKPRVGPGRLRSALPWVHYGYSARLKGWLRANAKCYDAVIVNGIWNYVSYGTWRALHAGDVPYFVFTHGMLDPWFNTAYPIKAVFKTLFWKLFEHKVLRDARGVMFTCEEERQLARGSFAPYAAREFVVGYGAHKQGGDREAQRSAFYAKVPAVRERPFILFLSRIHAKKGVDLLVSAFAEVCAKNAGFDLVIAGPDDAGLAPVLQAQARALGVSDRIHWPGMLTGDAKWGAFAAAAFFVLPSHQENFGIVVAEAMAMGTPVLITNKVNIWREVEADGAGHVVNDDTVGITAGLRAMGALSAAELAACGERARMSFLNRYDMVKNAMSFQSLLASLISARTPPS